MTPRNYARIVTLSLLLLGLLAKSHAAEPIPVTTLADSGSGSLRQALATSAPGSEIIFTTNGTIFLTSGPLFINQDLKISGPCAQLLTIDAQGSSTALIITNNAKVTISDITISNAMNSGRPPDANGGGIRNFGDLTLIRVVVVNNSSETLGGGIYNFGTLTLRDCTISRNSAPIGGGIGDDGFGRLIVESSTISSNIAAFPQGSSGGGIYKTHNIALLTNATISETEPWRGTEEELPPSVISVSRAARLFPMRLSL